MLIGDIRHGHLLPLVVRLDCENHKFDPGCTIKGVG